MLGVEDRIDIHAGTFSKAFGTYGGFVAGPKDIMFYLRCMAPTMLFTKATPACVVAATLKSFEVVRGEEGTERRKKAWANANTLQSTLRERGFDVGVTQTPITPISFGGNSALHVAEILRHERGIWVSPVVYPAVRRGAAIVRVIPTALHTDEDITLLVDALESAFAEYKAGKASASSEQPVR